MFSEAGLLTNAFAWALLLGAPVVNAAANVDLSNIGPSTSLSAKSTICNVLDYGGVADGETDIGPAITKAYSSCVTGNAATLYVPEGNYSLATGVKLSGASGWAFQLDGLITLTSDGDFDGNAIVIETGSDIEFFSSNNLGAINGQGYIMRRDSTSQDARLLRFISTSDVSIHNIILIDAPTFHLVLNEVSNIDVYYITVRGADVGGTDGIDLICTDNCYVHEFEVTNRDECVSVKSPSNNVLIEDAYCNHSGGMSIGSLTADIDSSSDAAAVSNITMRNVYAIECTEMLMIKTFPGGTGSEGYVKDSLFENFFGYDTTYALDIDQYWESHTTPDTGAVALSGLTFRNWTGSLANGIERGAVVIRGSDIVPAQDITLEDFDMWSLYSNKVVNQCKNVYGTGLCIQATSGSATYTTSATSTASPTGWTTPTAPSWALTTGYGSTIPIPVYTPAVFWPTASTAAASASATATASTSVVSSASSADSSATVSSISSDVKAISASATASESTLTTPSASASVFSSAEADATTASSASSSSSSVAPVASASSAVSASATVSESALITSSASASSSDIVLSSTSASVISSAEADALTATPSLSSSVVGTAASSYAAVSSAISSGIVTASPEPTEVQACPAPALVTVYV